MAIKRPDIYEHNNPLYAIADSDFVRGGIRTAVSGLTGLYALSGNTDQLKEHSTIVYNSGDTKYYILVDIANVGNASGWNEFQTGGGAGTITGATNGIILVNSGTTVALGGSLTGDTVIDASGNSFTINNIEDFQVKTSGDTTILGVDNNGFVFTMSGGSVTFDDDGGLKYGADYSSGYTAQSIPDVAWVTGQTVGQFLKLDQTTQQTVTGGTPIFQEGIILETGGTAQLITGHTRGFIFYDCDYQTVSAQIGSETTLQLGQEMIRWVYNNTPSSISDGSLVYVTGVYSGASVNTVTIDLAIATGVTQASVIGMTTQTIPSGDFGFITTQGNVNGLNTVDGVYSGMTVGDELYLSPTVAGGVTNIPPVSPNINVNLGRLLTKDATDGKIFVNINPALSLNDLTDVSTPSPSLDNVLKFNGLEWVAGNVGQTSAGSGVNYYYATPIIDAVTSPAGLSQDGTAGNGIQVATFTKTPVTTGGTVIVAGLSGSDIRAFVAWEGANPINRDTIDSGLWEFYDYVGVSATGGDTYLLHALYQIKPITGSTITTSGAGANSRTATITSSEFGGMYFNPSATNTEASYLQTESGIYQITASASTNSVTITVPTGYVNETAVSGNTWNPLFTGSTESIETTTTGTSAQLYQTKIVAPAFDTELTDKLGQILFADSTGAVTVVLSYNGTAAASFVISPFVTLHNDLPGLQGGSVDERYHLTEAEAIVVGNTSGINTGDETKTTIETKLTGEILTHYHPYSGLTGKPDLTQYQSVSGFTGYTATTQPVIEGAITGVTNTSGGTGVYSGTTDRNIQLYSLVGSGGTTVQQVGDQIIVQSDTASGSQQYSGETPSALDLGGINIGYELTGKTVSCIIQDLLVPELCGTITEPSISIQLTCTGTKEIGCVLSQTVTGNYNQGCINPQYCSASDKRNPDVNAYQFTGTGMPVPWQTCTALSAAETNASYTVVSGSQSWGVCARYDSGTTALSSKGTPYGAAPVSGCTNAASGSITGILPYFYGVSATQPTANQALIDSGTKVVASSTGTINITYGSQTSKYLWFATPNASTTKQGWYEGPTNKGNIGSPSDLFDAPSSVSVDSPSACWSGETYKIYISTINTDTSANPYCMTNTAQQ